MNEREERTKGMCDRCFMVREFVFLKGGVSECPAAWYELPRWGSGSLVFHTKTDQTA